MFTTQDAIMHQLRADGATSTEGLLAYVREQATDYTNVEGFDTAMTDMMLDDVIEVDSVIDGRVYWDIVA